MYPSAMDGQSSKTSGLYKIIINSLLDEINTVTHVCWIGASKPVMQEFYVFDVYQR